MNLKVAENSFIQQMSYKPDKTTLLGRLNMSARNKGVHKKS